jgi:prolyl oligopeptidase
MRARPVHYPKTRREDVTDEAAGVRFDDPYRWLERDSDEVQAWQAEQNELTTRWLEGWPHLDRLRAAVRRYQASRFGEVARFAGGRWFRRRTPAGGDHAVLEVGSTPAGPGRVLVDPDARRRDRPLNVEWFSPSPDGRLLAYGLSEAGDEANRLYVLDVETSADLPDRVPQILNDGWTGGAQWLADGSGFWYTARDERSGEFRVALFFHRLGADPPAEPEPLDLAHPWAVPQVSADGRWVAAVVDLMRPRPQLVRSLEEGTDWRPFVRDGRLSVAGVFLDDRYVGITDLDAPRGRLVSVPLDAGDDPTRWTELVPESDAVLRTVRLVGTHLYVSEFVDAFARIRIFEPDGTCLGEVPLPERGVISEPPFPLMGLIPQGHPQQYLFSFSTLTRSWAQYRFVPETGRAEQIEPPATGLEAASVETRRATSPDGTSVPFHLVSRADVDRATPRPTLIYAYGGFNVPFVPQFPGPMVAFVEAGGVFVHAHLRGGAEFGRDWWRGGRMRSKQNGYDDLFAVAERLIADGVTTAALLAVTGGSNGGLMAGVAATQRPDLWAVCVPRVPILDLIGALRDPYGRMATQGEFADPSRPEEIQRLASFSPYQLARDGERYPALFFDAGATDPRCPAWHARKTAARMQAANASEHPILLRVREDMGHGWSTGAQDAATQDTEWLAFVMEQLGMVPR